VLDHDPFDDTVPFGSFAQVNSSLWRHQLKGDEPFDTQYLNIKTLNGEANEIATMDYNHYQRYAGVWDFYDECIQTQGATRSKLTDIGVALFGGCSTYGEYMQKPTNVSPETQLRAANEYENRVRRIAANKPLLRAIRNLPNLGFTSASYEEAPMERDADRAEAEESKDEPFRAPDASMALSGGGGRFAMTGTTTYAKMPRGHKRVEFMARTSSTKARRGRGDEDDDDDDDGDDRSSQRRRTAGPDTPGDKAFRRYLERQPAAARGRKLAYEFDKIKSSRAGGSDATIVALRVMSDDLLGASLVAAAHKVSQKQHTRYPLTALEKKALHAREWSNRDQDVMAELHQADVQSVRWNNGDSPMEVYLDAGLAVAAELHQGSGALTLSSAYATLFKVTPRMMDRAMNTPGGTTVQVDWPRDEFDLVRAKGKARFALLQHSVNLSFAFEAVREAGVDARGDIKVLMGTDEALSTDQARLVSKLRKLVDLQYADVAREAGKDLGVAPLQLPLSRAIRAANALVLHLYGGRAADDKGVVRAYSKVLMALAPGSQRMSRRDDEGDDDDDGDDDQAMTSGVRTNKARMKHRPSGERPQLDDTNRAALDKLIKDALDGAAKAMNKFDVAAIRRGAEAGAQLAHVKARIDLTADDIYALYLHYLDKCKASPDRALAMVKQVVGVLQLVYSRKQDAFLGGAVDTAVLADMLVAEQFNKVHDMVALEDEQKWLQADEAILLSDSNLGVKLAFPTGTSVLHSLMEEYLAENKKRGDNIRAVMTDIDDIAAEYNDTAMPTRGGGGGSGRAVHTSKPPRYEFQGPERDVYDALSKVKKEMKGVDWWRTQLSPEPTTEAQGIALLQAYFAETGQSLLTNDLVTGPMSPAARTLLGRLAGAGWASANYLPSRSRAEANHHHGMDADYAAVARLLDNVPLEDCRLNALFLQHGVEPILGLLYFWPWIVALGCHACMVRDGDVGNVMYIEPDCLLSENGQQKLVFFHMSMYFKGMVMDHTALARAYFVYCRQVLGGLNHQAWNPLDESDVNAVYTKGQNTFDHGKTLFVVPTHIDREQRAEHMSLPGYFPREMSLIIAEERKTTEYEVAEVLTEKWNWAWEDGMVSGWADDKKRRYEGQTNGQRFGNVIMSQAHQECFDRFSQGFTHLKANKGIMGPDIYDGCMDAWNGSDRIKDKRGSIDLQLRTGRVGA
jgi:hypothetical protein